MSGSAASEIQERVEEALRARGVRGRVALSGPLLSLGPGEPIDISGTLEQWRSLPEDLRRKRCAELASLLAEPPRTSDRPRARARSWEPPTFLAPLAILGIVAACIAFAYQKLAPPRATGDKPPSVPASASAEPPRGTTLAGGCELARTRAVQGASLGPTDWEGWVVELVLFRPDSEALPHALDGFIAPATATRGARLTWPAAPHLTAVERFDANVEIGDVRVNAGSAMLRGLAFDFYGPYVAPFFREEQHGEYLALASALADRLNASHGALYAHCHGDRSPHLGAWFRGPSAGEALAALLYFTGALGHPPALEIVTNDAPDSLGALRKSIGAVDRASAATELAAFRAVVAGRADAPVSISFPFREGDLATRAALAVARAHHLRN